MSFVGHPFELDSADIKTEFWRGVEDETEYWKAVAPWTIPSDRESETYRWLRQLPMLEKWTNLAGIPEALTGKESYTRINEDFGLNFTVTDKDVRRDKTKMYLTTARSVGQGVNQRKNYEIATLLEGADADELLFDAQYLYDDAHPGATAAGAATTFDNLRTGAYSTANLKANISAMKKFRLPNGALCDPAGPSHIIIPTDLEWEVREDLESRMRPDNANMADNVVQGALDIIVLPHLSSATAYYLVNLRRAYKPFFWQEEQALRFFEQQPGGTNPTQEWMTRRDYSFSVDHSGNFGVSYWWLTLKSTGA